MDDPADPGGLTKYGISQAAWPHLDIANLALDQAAAIYRRSYWLANGCDRIEDQGLACKLFDLCVNMGGGRAVRMLQRAANHLGAQLVVDGHLGPVTAAAINKYKHPRALLMAFRALAAQHYLNQRKQRFLAGWLNRLAE